MRDVILRNAPGLAPRLTDVRNMFCPWGGKGS
jgi:hypothetical protein